MRIKAKKLSQDLGERRIIEIIQEQLEILPKIPIPFGDDVSAYDVGNNNLAVLKTDMLVDKTDVPTRMSLWQAARKAVVMNISDFAAKGVKPVALLVSLGLPRTLAEKDIIKIGKGLNAGAREYDAYVLGGDTNESTDLVISVSLFGIAKKSEVILRSEARPGDVVAVTGTFGKTAAGLRFLLANSEASSRIDRILVESVLMPQARLKEGLALCKTKAVTASIDSSDGLAWSLHEIARASNVGFLIDTLPIDDTVRKFAKTNKLNPLELTLYGGEEYELVITVKPKLWSRAEKVVEQAGGRILPIGKVTGEKQILLKTDRKRSVIEARGWEHFKSSDC